MITDLIENEISKAPLIVSWPKWHRTSYPVGKILDLIMNSWRCSKKKSSFSTETLHFCWILNSSTIQANILSPYLHCGYFLMGPDGSHKQLHWKPCSPCPASAERQAGARWIEHYRCIARDFPPPSKY